MPGVYSANRAAQDTGAAGLKLPFTNTKGPVSFKHDVSHYVEVQTGKFYASTTPPKGIKTYGISDCAVFCAAEMNPNGQWGKVLFCHVDGGSWGNLPKENQISKIIISPHDSCMQLRIMYNSFIKNADLSKCYAFMVIPSGYGYRDFLDLPPLYAAGSLKNINKKPKSINTSTYIANTAMGLGFAVTFNATGDFGEIGAPKAKEGNLFEPFGFQPGIDPFDLA
jgi:hypothetical protein